MALVVFTGGARSGKSSAAAMLARSRELDGAAVCAVVFGRVSDSDPEFAERVRRHREDRPASWVTCEVCSAGELREAIAGDRVVVLDCIGTMLGLVMEEEYGADAGDIGGEALAAAPADVLPNGYETRVERRFMDLVDALLGRGGDTVVVTNEVGDGLVPSYATGRLFRDLMGQANRMLVASADAAYVCVAGRLVDLSALPCEARWPED